MVVDFHFDFLSPYAYLAWKQIHGIAARNGASVRPIPTLFAALLAHGGTKGPAEIPAKRAYLFVDTLRMARQLGLPLAPPPTHPFHPLIALRACSVVDGDEQVRLIDALFDATWGGGEGCDTIEKIAEAAIRVGLDGVALAASAGSGVAKERLRQQTDAAIAAGVFGVPTMRVGPGVANLFWGCDSLPALERHLRREGVVTDEDLRRWSGLSASASRK